MEKKTILTVDLKVSDIENVKSIIENAKSALEKANEKIERYEMALTKIEKILESSYYPKELHEIREVVYNTLKHHN